MVLVGAWSIGELVADSVNREHVTRTSRLRLDLAPEVLDVGVDCALE
jgi:hypothetical protein